MTAIDQSDKLARSTPAQAPRSRTKRLGVAALGGAAAVAAAIFAYHWLTVGRYLESTNDAYLRADPMIVAPRIAGYVDQVMVVANQDVEAGQVLARIDPATYQAQLAKAKAQVDQAQADIDQLQAQVARQESVRDQATAQETMAATAEAFAGRDAGRFSNLEHSGAVSAQQADQARTLQTQRRADSANARAAVVSAARQIDVLKAQIGQAQSALEAARAAETSAQLDLDATVLRSRIKGRIGDKSVTVGQYVEAGTRLMSVMPLQDIYLEANFKETQIGRMRVGQKAEIDVDALPGTKVAGTVESLAPGTGSQFALMPPENATGNFTKIVQRVPVRIRITADPGLRAVLLPGLSVTATVDTKDTANGGR